MKYRISFLLNNVKDGVGRLQMRVQWDGNMLKYNLGYAVNADRWDCDIQMCRNNSFHGKKKVSAAEINKEIRRYRLAVDTAVLTLPAFASPSREEFRRLLDTALGKATGGGTDKFQAVANDFIITESKVRQWSVKSTENYRAVRIAVEKWKPGLALADLDENGLLSFLEHLYDKRLKNTTIKSYLVRLKAVLAWADKSGRYSVDEAYKKFNPRIKTVQKPIVWLKWDEVLLLYEAELKDINKCPTPTFYNEVRDIFCLGCLTGMRWSDLNKLRHSDIHDGKIHLSVKKTDASIVIDLNRRARAILDRYKDLDEVYAMPRISNMTCTREIKVICRALGIDAPTTTVYYTGADKVEVTEPKYKFVGMHTARRSFVCNALEKGISPQVIISWTGHASLEELKPYIAISDKTKERMMKLFDE